MSRIWQHDRVTVRVYTPAGVSRGNPYTATAQHDMTPAEYALGVATCLSPGDYVRLSIDCSPGPPLLYAYQVGERAGTVSVTRATFEPYETISAMAKRRMLARDT